MKLIIPMAGMGKRMRPHTLTIPKPLIPVAGKPIVSSLVDEIHSLCKNPIDEIVFITGHFGADTENHLIQIAEQLNAKGRICYQEEPLGTAHAILCADYSLEGPVIVAFADTLFFADFDFNPKDDAVIWVHQVSDPSSFGVVELDNQGYISNFHEKPKEFVSDLAIIGIYYFQDGKNLKNELQYLIDNKVCVNGEYQLTDALENMKNKKLKMSVGKVNQWLDCGNKDATLNANRALLIQKQRTLLIPDSAIIKNSTIIQPCFIGENVEISNAVIGPFVSVNDNSQITHSNISNSIIQKNSQISHSIIKDSMIGNYVRIDATNGIINVGDYSFVNK